MPQPYFFVYCVVRKKYTSHIHQNGEPPYFGGFCVYIEVSGRIHLGKGEGGPRRYMYIYRGVGGGVGIGVGK